MEDISLRPELSSPPRFRFQGGGEAPWAWQSPNEVKSPEILVYNIEYSLYYNNLVVSEKQKGPFSSKKRLSNWLKSAWHNPPCYQSKHSAGPFHDHSHSAIIWF